MKLKKYMRTALGDGGVIDERRGIDTRRADLPLSCELEIWMDAAVVKKICVFSLASNFSAAALAFIPRTMGNIVLVKEDQ